MTSEKKEFTFAVSSQAGRYDKYISPMFVPWIDALIALSPPSPDTDLLDVATGTGEVAYRLAAAINGRGNVLGVDPNDAMLQRARQKAASAQFSHVAGSLSWMEANAGGMELPEAKFDAAYCHQGLQFMPTALDACRLTQKALKPGAQFAAACWAPPTRESNPLFYAIRQSLEKLGKGEWAQGLGVPFSWGETEAAGVARMTETLREAGFVDCQVFVKEINARLGSVEEACCVGTATPFGDTLLADSALFDAYKESFCAEMQKYTNTETGEVVVPLRSIFSLARVPVPE